MLTENSVGDDGVYLKTLSPRKDNRSESSEVMKRSCSPKPKDTFPLLYEVSASTKPLIWVFWAINEEEKNYDNITVESVQRFAQNTFVKEKSNTLYYLKK